MLAKRCRFVKFFFVGPSEAGGDNCTMSYGGLCAACRKMIALAAAPPPRYKIVVILQPANLCFEIELNTNTIKNC